MYSWWMHELITRWNASLESRRFRLIDSLPVRVGCMPIRLCVLFREFTSRHGWMSPRHIARTTAWMRLWQSNLPMAFFK